MSNKTSNKTTFEPLVFDDVRNGDDIGQITDAAASQSNGIGNINDTMSGLEQMTHRNAAMVQQSAAAATSLQSQAKRLIAMVSAFKLRATDTAVVCSRIPDAQHEQLPHV